MDNLLPANIEVKEVEEDMKGITKRKDNRYMIRKTVNGIRITKYARTYTEAKEILRKIKNGKIKPKQKEIEQNYKFEEYANYWLDTYKKPFLKERTYLDIKYLINHLIEKFGKMKISDLTTHDIQQFYNKMKQSRSKEKTFTYLNSILQKAFDTGIIDRNPFNAVVKDKKLKCKLNAYTFKEQETILDAIKGTDIEHEIYVYLLCGCRPNELPKNKQFDFENNFINIYGTKNDNALHRVIEMSEEFANYIKPYVSKNTILEENYVSKRFIDLCKQRKIERPLLYRLRHTFATNHFTLGTQAKQVQEWLGHASIQITLDQYTDIDKTATKDKLLKLYNNFYYIKK